MKALALLNSLLRTFLATALAAVLGYGAWLGYQTYHAHELALQAKDEELAERQAQIDALELDVAAKAQQIERLETAMQLLKVDERVAQIVVLDQTAPREGDHGKTLFRFSEVDQEGNPIGDAKTITIEGDIVYLDAWVVKYLDEHVEQADPLRATSVCLFRRIFGEFQQPTEGFVIDAQGSRPSAYGGAEMSDFEREIWANFWEYANDPERARASGIRAAHGEAPSIKLQAGKLYRVQLRASDGLSIVADDLPAALRGPAL
ncbi:MAG: hypothetical protein KF708_23010 [Pirellulales bacterium]|nr:hypothetical protein [Pirellulales bacterium]